MPVVKAVRNTARPGPKKVLTAEERNAPAPEDELPPSASRSPHAAQPHDAQPCNYGQDAKAHKGRPPANELGDDAAQTGGEPLPRKGDAHEQANGGGAVLRRDHVSHQRLGDANDSRGKAAGQDACRHQRGQARRQRADQGAHGKPSHDDAQQPHAPHAVSDGAAHRLQRAVGHQVRGQDDRHHGRRHGKRPGYGRKRR